MDLKNLVKLIELARGTPLPEFDQYVIAIGDIHGQIDALKVLIRFITAINVPVIFLGDTIDRSPKTLETLDFLISLKLEHPKKYTLLLGNHEREVIKGFLKGYCELMCDPNECAYQHIMNSKSPQKYLNFIKTFKRYKKISKAVFCHAPIGDRYSAVVLKQVPVSHLTWNRNPARYAHGLVVHGHNSSIEAYQDRDIEINLDTSFFETLTAGIIGIGQSRDSVQLLGTVSVNHYSLALTIQAAPSIKIESVTQLTQPQTPV